VNQGDRSVVMKFPLPITWDDSGRFRIQNNVTPSLKDMKLTAANPDVILQVGKRTDTGQ
jgi:hypothetical protein